MKKIIVILIITGMLAWAVYDLLNSSEETADSGDYVVEEDTKEESASGESESNNKVGLEIGNMAPDFELKTLKGETVKLSDYRGQRVLVNFWATWCPPCRAEMPDMEKFHQNKDITILAINLTETESTSSDVTDFVEKFELTFPILMDEKVEVANRYQIQPIPTSYMIDSNGRIQYKALGAMNYELMVQEFEKMK
ncbi:peroxiredoxin family protein [Virgibacillus litoralis]|uniref:Peroxiredoxin n=1 Tax=Virgibacillus litoralis TaxID=578221 RepID=A0ABS4HBA0_9BACI|nr:TlpA disulfide reductase family protein [Virgibacillus litoralis]MBP1948187.1 peroxiredoxin [Virgibacillus litoralis]